MSCVRVFESLGQWHDYWTVVLLSAPDDFSEFDSEYQRVHVADQAAALLDSYDTLLSGFSFAEKKLKDEVTIRIVRELIEMAFESYREGEGKRGGHTLQEAEGMIWSSRQRPVKYAVEAERRAFGEVVRYKGVRVSRFPYEGKLGDLGMCQSQLLAIAEEHCRSSFRDGKEFKLLSWVRRTDGTFEKLRVTSRKKLLQQLHELQATQQINGAVVCELPLGPVHGLIAFELHEEDWPEVVAIATISNWTYGSLQIHLDEPSLFRQ
jgi:hypothetical protein